MPTVEERLAGLHPDARSRKRVRPDAKYVSDGWKEFYIDRDYNGFYFVVPYRGGELHKRIAGRYTTMMECERHLVSYLIDTNKFGRAIYPQHG